MPTLLVNENFPVPALKLLRAQGVQAEAVQELMPGAPDTTVLAYAVAHGHWLVTFDRDYGELVFVRISVIVDAHFSLIVDGETASSKARRGVAHARVRNVAQASTISLKRSAARGVSGLVLGLD